MLEFVTDHLKTKRLCKNAVTRLQFPIKYVPDRYKTQQMCYKIIKRNGGILILLLTTTRIKTCIMKLLMIILIHYLSMNSIRPKNV